MLGRYGSFALSLTPDGILRETVYAKSSTLFSLKTLIGTQRTR